jgi:hypothetical protein
MCELPILLSFDKALIKLDQSLFEFKLSKTDLISLKNITFKARNEFIVYLINDAEISSVKM